MAHPHTGLYFLIDMCSSEELLKVKFAGVAITGKEAKQWLRTYLLGRWVWLTLLHRSDDPPALQCVVHARSRVSWQGLRQ